MHYFQIYPSIVPEGQKSVHTVNGIESVQGQKSVHTLNDTESVQVWEKDNEVE